MNYKVCIALCCMNLSLPAIAQYGSPQLYSANGQYLGNLNNNRFDPNSVANPYGRYGSRFSSTSINNPYGTYGSAYSYQGVRNRYASAGSPVVRAANGTYLGRYNANKYDPQSVSNSYGQYGSKYSPVSINNPYGTYGNKYSLNSATNSYGTNSNIKHGGLFSKLHWPNFHNKTPQQNP